MPGYILKENLKVIDVPVMNYKDSYIFKSVSGIFWINLRTNLKKIN